MSMQFDRASFDPATYRAYLIRLWQDTPDTPWRASAQSVQSGEIVRFGSLQALWAFLEAQTADIELATAPPAKQATPRSNQNFR